MKEIIVIVFGLASLILLEGRSESYDKEIISYNYSEGEIRPTQEEALLKIFGLKKVGTLYFWIQSILEVGRVDNLDDISNKTKRIVDLSEGMTYLNPYFVDNYRFTGGVLGFIRVYNNPKEGYKVLERGVRYNKDSEILKWYLGGLVAKAKGNKDELIVNLENIVDEEGDGPLVIALAYLYDLKYKETRNEKYLKKAKYYKGKIPKETP